MLTIICSYFLMTVAVGMTPMPETKSSIRGEEPKVYTFSMKTIDGDMRSLSAYKGKVILIVNVASNCGYTPQYEGLEALYERFKDKGFMVLGFPSNDFLWQEPGSDAEIKQFCSATYGVSFDMFSKISVKGTDQHPLYKYLTEETSVAGPVKWNFQKYLVTRTGEVVAKFASGAEPLDKEVVKRIQELLAEPS